MYVCVFLIIRNSHFFFRRFLEVREESNVRILKRIMHNIWPYLDTVGA